MKFTRIMTNFNKHYEKYDCLDKNISRKYKHSLRVAAIAEILAKCNNVSLNDIKIAKLTGLLHDYARFEQWTIYNTYNDRLSIDHGDLAAKRLFVDKEIEDFWLDEKDYHILEFAIRNHNKLKIEETSYNRQLWFAQLVRDADKLDIFYLLGEQDVVLEEDLEEVSDNVKNDFYNQKQISYIDEKNKNDHIILFLSMVFDLNFPYSYIYLKEKKYTDKIYNTLSNKERFKEYFEYINNFIKEKCENVR